MTVVTAAVFMAPTSRVEGAPTAETLLKTLQPDGGNLARIHVLVAQLGADDFTVREAAMQELEAFPALPPEVVAQAKAEGDPEVLLRLNTLLAKTMVDRRAATLAKALALMVETEDKGLFDLLIAVLKAGVPCHDSGMLERAVMSTAGKDDAVAIEALAGSELVLLRQVAAAGAATLGKHGALLAQRLLDDANDEVRLRAAITLGNMGMIEGGKALSGFLASDDTTRRVRAWKALQGLTGKAFGYSPLAREEPRRAGADAWATWLSSPDAKLTGTANELSWRRLFNGTDLTGWTVHAAGRALGPEQKRWTVQDGILKNIGRGPGDLRTDERFDNYILTVTFRPPVVGADSGIGVMLTADAENPNAARRDGGSYLEVQLLPGRSGDLYVIGNFRAESDGKRIAFSHRRRAQVKDTPAVWHEARLEVTKGTLTVFINGTEVNRSEGGPKEPGKILLREETSGFEFKEITLLPLDDALSGK